MKKTAHLLIALLLCFTSRGSVVAERNFYFSPGLSIGHTFGAGLSYGFCMDVGIWRIKDLGAPVNAGFSFSRHWVHVKKYSHRISTLNVMVEGNNFDAKAGLGLARNKWGYGHHNRCRVPGINYDLSITAGQLYAPWLGFRKFDYPASGWAWFGRPYSELYVKYKYDVLGRSGLKKQEELPF